jgi:hypothetical protein
MMLVVHAILSAWPTHANGDATTLARYRRLHAGVMLILLAIHTFALLSAL